VQVAPPLPDDLVTRGVRDEMGESLQGDTLSVADVSLNRIG
jgi:hypothetical protein